MLENFRANVLKKITTAAEESRKHMGEGGSKEGNYFTEKCEDLAGKTIQGKDEHFDTRRHRDISPNCGQGLAQRVPYSEEKFLRFCVHNTNLYSVLATHHAIKAGKEDPAVVLHTLFKKKMSIEYCTNLIDMDLLQKLGSSPV